jgi:hypothetical protein
MFRDEFIGDLLQALPHPELDYDRWMMELDPKERNRRHHFGEPETVAFPPQTSLLMLITPCIPQAQMRVKASRYLSPVHVLRSQEGL